MVSNTNKLFKFLNIYPNSATELTKRLAYTEIAILLSVLLQ